MSVHITGHRSGFGPGLTEITRFGEPDDTGIALSVLRLSPGEVYREVSPGESALLLMTGELALDVGAVTFEARRTSLFDELPSCVHVGAGAELTLTARTSTELTIYRTRSTAALPSVFHAPRDVRDEARGKGVAGDASLRFVRTIFDRTNTHPAAELVLGEVVNLPGRWSSYPPHHHPQPELYHYRFTAPQGYGHAELGDTVLKVRANDTVKIFDGLDHPQCAAPGYGMYYSWVIRHLPGQVYDVPEFAPEHRWISGAGPGSFWWPRGVEHGE